MPAERAGYTVTIFLVDLSPSMGHKRTTEVPEPNGGDPIHVEMTNLEWSLQFAKLKIQEMIFNGRKTDQCGVIVFGTPETNNVMNERGEGYEHIYEYIPIGQPNATTLTKLDALRATSVCGDPIDAIIVGIDTQHLYLASRKTWTRRMVLITDGESPIELDGWERTTRMINERNINFTIVGVDFDDEEFPYKEAKKSSIKKVNEDFYRTFKNKLDDAILGTCALALREVARPDLRVTKSVLMGTVLRIGDVDARPEEAMEIIIKTSKCTAVTRPKGWKRFMKREADEEMDKMDVDGISPEEATYAQLKMRSEYFLEKTEEDNSEQEDIMQENDQREERKIEKEELVKGFKYGSTYVSCPDGQFERLKTRKGIDICGFFNKRHFHREFSMGEVQYIWADPGSPNQQVALSSIAQAMTVAKVFAIARWVSRDGMDPRMGILAPCSFSKVDCLLWVQMPFADDVRKYTFASLDTLINKKGERVTKHPYLPTNEQLEAMDDFVDAMDLTDAGDKDENGERLSWYDNRLSYNPAVHRIKQAMFHSAVVNDVVTHPLPPPHPDLLKYFDPPRRVLKRAGHAIEQCKQTFKVKRVPKRVAKVRKDGHVHAREDDEDMLLLDKATSGKRTTRLLTQVYSASQESQPATLPTKKLASMTVNDSDTETEDEELLLDQPVSKKTETPDHPLPTPSRSASPAMPEIDRQKAPGRIVGNAFPLQDFRGNIAEGDVVSKAVEDLAFVVRDVVKKPFAPRRYQEMIGCMRELRDVCLKEDEIDAWNDFMMELRDECIEEQPGNSEFWAEVRKEGRSMSLISKPEAAQVGGKSKISESVAAEFIQK